MIDTIEYYERGTDRLIVTVKSSIVPTVGSAISILKKTWIVDGVTYAIDYASHNPDARGTRANVILSK